MEGVMKEVLLHHASGNSALYSFYIEIWLLCNIPKTLHYGIRPVREIEFKRANITNHSRANVKQRQ